MSLYCARYFHTPRCRLYITLPLCSSVKRYCLQKTEAHFLNFCKQLSIFMADKMGQNFLQNNRRNKNKNQIKWVVRFVFFFSFHDSLFIYLHLMQKMSMCNAKKRKKETERHWFKWCLKGKCNNFSRDPDLWNLTKWKMAKWRCFFF